MEGGPSIQEAENYIESVEDDDKTPGCDIGLCDPRRPLHRFIALIFMCLLGFGKFTNRLFFCQRKKIVNKRPSIVCLNAYACPCQTVIII